MITTNELPLLPYVFQAYVIKIRKPANSPDNNTPITNLLHYFFEVFWTRILKKKMPLLTVISRSHLFLCKDSLLEAALLLNENRAAVMVTLFVNLVASQPQIKRK